MPRAFFQEKENSFPLVTACTWHVVYDTEYALKAGHIYLQPHSSYKNVLPAWNDQEHFFTILACLCALL